ncbi:MAG TPA: hypothetical protein PLX89_17100 [Verrucomicrobiota bacterium]|nr:hypothetical protein [Verrucomicrobiales bacterium]HRI14715.1 hypothetical protein [Verrucomicrobiota bacterium]
MNDEELLKVYVGEGSQDAFAELVRRHVGLVYATALRQLREPSTAQEVTPVRPCELPIERRRESAAQRGCTSVLGSPENR